MLELTPNYAEKWLDHNEISGIVGCRAVVYWMGKLYSPIYSSFEWSQAWHEATCPIGCVHVPSEVHTGCGFHAHYSVAPTQKFVEQIRGAQDLLVLTEMRGKVVTHETGFRGQKARIIAILEWSPTCFISPLPPSYDSWSLLDWAQKFLNVPRIDTCFAQEILDFSQKRFGVK